jgi:dolichol-phosphate mannosyltransferase
MYKLGIVTPCYNESQNIQELLSQIDEVVCGNKIKTLVLIVDDASPDGTALIVKKLIEENQSEYLDIRILERTGKLGLGTAYIQGIGQITGECEFVMEMDADLSHQPKYIVNFLEAAEMNNLDLVIGSRYIAGGGIENWDMKRKAISRFGSLYAKIILRVNVNDFTGGYNMFRSTFVNKINLLAQIESIGYLFQIEMKYRSIKAGAKFQEVPIIFPDRVNGVSKMSGSIIQEAAVGVFKLKLNIK